MRIFYILPTLLGEESRIAVVGDLRGRFEGMMIGPNGYQRWITCMTVILTVCGTVDANATQEYRSSEVASRSELTLTATNTQVAIPERKPVRGSDRRTAALNPSTPPIPGKLLLQSGNLKARIENARHNSVIRAGSSAFIDVILTNTSGRRVNKAELLLLGDGAKVIRTQSADKKHRIKMRKAGGGHVVSIGRLRARDSRKIYLELKLDGAKSVDSENILRASLRVSLNGGKAEGHEQDATLLEWEVSDPARAYHTALAQLDAENGEEIYNSIQEARVGNPDLPGRWLFRPVRRLPKPRFDVVTRKISKSYCARYRRATRAERRRARQRGRRIRRVCVRRASRQVTRKVRVPIKQKDRVVGKEEMRILRLASNAVVSRGAVPALRKSGGQFGWISSRIAVDLRTYMSQKHNPALCSGMNIFMDYLVDRSVSFRRRIETIHKARREAPSMAAARVKALRDAFWQMPGGHPASGSAPLAILTPFPEDADVLLNLRQMAGHVVSLAVSPEIGQEVSESASDLDGLKRAAEAIREPAFKHQSAEIKRAARRALTMMEAAYYLRLADNHYTRVKNALFGGIRNVREAHAKTCIARS